MSLQECRAALAKAKISLMQKPDSAFYVALAYEIPCVFDESVPTACTDGKQVLFGPKFFMSLDPAEKLFLLLHELKHIVLMHCARGKLLDFHKYNIAGDHVINLKLIENGYKMPQGGLADPKYKGMYTEEVYALIPDSAKKNHQMDIKPFEGTPEEGELLEASITDIIVRAKIQSELGEDKPGTVPGEVQIFLNKLLAPKLSWQKILQRYLNNFAKTDYSFKHPNRRFFPDNILPSMYSRRLMNIAIAVDTSGSVSDADFLRFVSEIASILRMMMPEKITVIQFDTSLKETSTVKSIRDLMNVKFTGRGGTDINPVINWANENKPQLLMVFTDGGFRFSNLTTKVNTLWMIHKNPKWNAPFGKTIHYDI